MNDDQQKLLDLRSKIVKDLVPLATDSDMDPTQKFVLLLSSARVNGDFDGFNRAYEAVSKIESSTEKANALIELADSIDDVVTANQPVEEADSENEESDPSDSEGPSSDASDDSTVEQAVHV